jgi:hypothetical protein
MKKTILIALVFSFWFCSQSYADYAHDAAPIALIAGFILFVGGMVLYENSPKPLTQNEIDNNLMPYVGKPAISLVSSWGAPDLITNITGSYTVYTYIDKKDKSSYAYLGKHIAFAGEIPASVCRFDWVIDSLGTIKSYTHKGECY